MKIKVLYRKLGRERVNGLAHCGYNEIEVDHRLKGKKLLEIIIHESLHILYPDQGEEEVQKKAIILTNTLWAEHYRKIDNDTTQTMQDGSK